ncbi:MAG: hypothetical protein JW833_13765 [Prolixibacteraceae bacterium]|nr:hypothetical protein [Prolixibacteraceae bacterium]
MNTILSKLNLKILVLLFYILTSFAINAQDSPNRQEIELLLVSDSNDAYFPLAREISISENAPLVASIDEINNFSPKFIIYVAEPKNISEENLLSISKNFKNSQNYPALGIITGKTIGSARKLYERRLLAKKGNNFIATDIDYSADFREGVIFDVSSLPAKKIPLNRENLLQALKKADYFYWARHVSYDGWFWNYKKYGFLHSRELPELKPVVIHTPSCNSVLPSKEDNIALEFIEKGAAAYIGHLFTPVTNAGTFIGHLQFLPGEYSWNEFPIGIMAQIQNVASIRASSYLPFMFILGDPRIYLTSNKPYTVIEDTIYGDKRKIICTSDIKGILPMKICNGASYSYVKIKGLSEISDNDCFQNTKIQSLNLQSDKYLLFILNGGTVEINLYKYPPFLWSFYDAITDAFDISWITKGLTRSYISVLFFFIFSIIIFFRIKRGKTIKSYLPEILFAIIFASFQLIFVSLRMHSISVSSYVFNIKIFKLLLGFIGASSLVACGLILIDNSKKNFTRFVGIMLCVLPQLLLTVFLFAVVTVRNYYFQSNFNINLWNWNSVFSPFIVMLIELLIVGTFLVLKRYYKNKYLRIE